MNTRSPAYDLVTGVLRVGLLASLIWAGWHIYHQLPGGEPEAGSDGAGGETSLVITLRPSAKDVAASVNIPVQLYPVDISAVQREYGFEPRPGVRFEDFLNERMQGRAPVKAQFDEHGQTVVKVSPGRWWIHALLSGAQNVEWRLPVNVAGRQQNIELNTGNVYARTKSF